MTFAFVFPGQGSQAVGMLDVLSGDAAAQAVLREAGEVLGEDLGALIHTGPKEKLDQTIHTQPAMLAAGVAVWRAWCAAGGEAPAFFAGHSLGEYSALVAAEALSLADAVRLVRLRAQAMQDAVPEGHGAMAAILGLDDAVVRTACAQAAQGGVVEAVNFNAPGQVVIAGDKSAVDRACALCREAGAKRALPLPVSVPSHCALMKPAAEQLRAALSQVAIRPPRVPVIHNADVAACNDPERIRDALARQLYSPVRWVETIQYLAAQRVTVLAECGPGKVLVGLTRRIAEGVSTHALTDPASLAALRAALA